MQKVIVNSTPLIVLGNIGYLWVLKELFGEIIVPQAVYDEVTIQNDTAGSLMDSEDWIIVNDSVKDADRKMYRARLHAGEVEVMLLDQEIMADMVIIDDNEAKKTAKYLGLEVTGTLGILMTAKRKGIIPSLEEVLQKLESVGFYMSDKLKESVLTIVKNDVT